MPIIYGNDAPPWVLSSGAALGSEPRGVRLRAIGLSGWIISIVVDAKSSVSGGIISLS